MIDKLFYVKMDKIIEKIDACRKEPEFTDELNLRNSKIPDFSISSRDLFKKMATLICFSQNARSDAVQRMVDTDNFSRIFSGFDIELVSAMDSQEIKDKYWDILKPIRFKGKIDSILNCAKIMNSGSINMQEMLKSVPVILKSYEDIDQFWKSFCNIRTQLEQNNMPFFKSTTSLLHLLLYLGYDCLKPDQIVMNVSINELHLVASQKNRDKIYVVKAIQQYCVDRQIRPAVVDFYLLAEGGQAWANQFKKC
jgi:hypothetical protein